MQYNAALFVVPDFNPRSREGSDFLLIICGIRSTDFNPRSREGSDVRGILSCSDVEYFNPRSREGSDRGADDTGGQARTISIHAPARGATENLDLQSEIDRFQSTLPRGERLHCGYPDNTSDSISIHAPARGATTALSRLMALRQISIHAPARGATGRNHCKPIFGSYFNPRSREGSDCTYISSISHTPNFNPRSREGSDGFGN